MDYKGIFLDPFLSRALERIIGPIKQNLFYLKLNTNVQPKIVSPHQWSG